MNWKRIVAAAFAAFLANTAFDVLWNAVILRETFEQTARYWRPASQLNRLVPFAWMASLLGSLLVGTLFVRFGGRGIRRGLELGAWLGLNGAVGTLAMATLVPWPMTLIAAMAVQNLVYALVVGVSFGWIYRDSRTLVRS